MVLLRKCVSKIFLFVSMRATSVVRIELKNKIIFKTNTRTKLASELSMPFDPFFVCLNILFFLCTRHGKKSLKFMLRCFFVTLSSGKINTIEWVSMSFM